MLCPYCGVDNASKVVDTTHEKEGGTRRRRECKNCGKRYSTFEQPILQIPMLIKSDGSREEFNPEKLIKGIRMACGKRPIPTADINGLVDRVQHTLQQLGKEEVPSRVVGDIVVNGLKELDDIAYIRYAIVYLGLNNLNSVRSEIDKLLASK